MNRTSVLRIVLAVLFAAGLTANLAGLICAEEHSGPIVPGFDRFLPKSGDEDVNAGLLLLGELNCLSCHADGGEQAALVRTKQAPILTKAGERIRAEYFARLLENPHVAKPGTTMPDALAGLPEAEKKRIATDLAAFLASTGRAGELVPAGALVQQGRNLFNSIGCLACHARQEDNAQPLPNSVPLGDLTAKYTIPGLETFLRDPLAFRPSGRMPHFNLNEQEARALASYLLRDIQVDPNLAFKYYEGDWQNLPDFSQLEIKAEGKSSGFDVTAGKRLNSFAMIFSGFLHIAKPGEYTFHLGSDDGSRLLIDGKEVARSDGVHPLTFQSGKKQLEAGPHPVVVEYFEGGGEEVLQVAIEGNGLARQPMESLMSIEREKKAKAEENEVVFTDKMAARGKQHFVTLGCANCHALNQGGDLKSELRSPSLADLKQGGCLAETAKAGVPNYRLSDRQRTVLQAAIKALQGNSVPARTAASDIHVAMLGMNCFACHVRDDFGGVPETRQELFKGDQQEMGDEGRLPPLLTGVGAKLRPEYLRQVIENGAKDRPYMMTRMPRFGSDGAKLADQLAQTDQLKKGPAGVSTESTRRLKVYGRKLAGEEGLSCIKCHMLGNFNATGIQAINLATMTKRLREDWFLEYMLDPNVFRPGTRMPGSWPNGQTFFKDMLGGDARQQVNALWVYLLDGEKAAIPIGLQSSSMELVARDEPVIYRNFIEGAGSRAIGVGYPERLNLAFDANQMRLALIWQGSFIDASRHWTGRGEGYQPPLGENVLRLPEGTAFAYLPDENADWPAATAKELDVRFKGYQFDEKRRPVFSYRAGDVQIEDAIAPEERSDERGELVGGFGRKINLSGKPEEKLYFRAAAAAKIEPLADDWYQIDDWKMQIKSGQKPLIRKSQNRMELIVPLDLEGGQSSIQQYFQW